MSAETNSLGKGEVESSNLSGSTRKPFERKGNTVATAPSSPANIVKTKKELPVKCAGKSGNYFHRTFTSRL